MGQKAQFGGGGGGGALYRKDVKAKHERTLIRYAWLPLKTKGKKNSNQQVLSGAVLAPFKQTY